MGYEVGPGEGGWGGGERRIDASGGLVGGPGAAVMFRTTRGLGAGERLSASAVPFCVSVLINCEAAALRALLGDRASRKSRQQRHQNSRHQWKSEHQRLSHEVFTHRPFWRMHHSRRRRPPPDTLLYVCMPPGHPPPPTPPPPLQRFCWLTVICAWGRMTLAGCNILFLHPPVGGRFCYIRRTYVRVFRFFCQGLRQGQGRACWCTGAQPWTERVTFAAERCQQNTSLWMCIKAKYKRSARDKWCCGFFGFSTHGWKISATRCIWCHIDIISRGDLFAFNSSELAKMPREKSIPCWAQVILMEIFNISIAHLFIRALYLLMAWIKIKYIDLNNYKLNVKKCKII